MINRIYKPDRIIATHDFNRGIKDSIHLSPALTVLTVFSSKPMNRFRERDCDIASCPMNEFMGCLPKTDGEQATHDFNRGIVTETITIHIPIIGG